MHLQAPASLRRKKNWVNGKIKEKRRNQNIYTSFYLKKAKNVVRKIQWMETESTIYLSRKDCRQQLINGQTSRQIRLLTRGIPSCSIGSISSQSDDRNSSPNYKYAKW